MKIRIALVWLALFLSGCASYSWNKPGFTKQEFSKDSYECERDARQSGYFGEGIALTINMRNFMDRCMIARGYQKVRNE